MYFVDIRGKYFKAIVAFLTYGLMQLACGLLLWLAMFITNGGKVGYAEAVSPLMLTISLLISSVLTVLLVWKPMGMIRMPSSFSHVGCSAKAAGIGLVAGAMGVVALNLMSEMSNLPDTTMETLQALAATPLGALTVGIVGPVCEELVFREGIQGYLHRNGTHPVVAIVVASLLFGILHFNPLQTFFAAFMGVVLGTLYYRTGSVLMCGLLHVANNSLAVVQMMILGDGTDDFSLSDTFGGQLNAFGAMAICGVSCIALLFWFCRATAVTASRKEA